MEAPGDLDRFIFFEQARITAEASYANNPLDADVRPLAIAYTISLFSG